MAIYVHIGAHKTGSTYLQAVLARSKEELAINSIKYLPQKCYWPLVKDSFVRAESKSLRGEASPLKLEPLGKFLEGDYRNFIISHEDFIGTTRFQKTKKMYPNFRKNVTDIYDFLEGFGQVKFILSIRRQADFFESCILQQVQQGAAFSIEKAIADFDFLSMSWRSIYDTISDLVGTDNVLLLASEEKIRGELSSSIRLLNWINPNISGYAKAPKDFQVGNYSLNSVGFDLAVTAMGKIENKQWKTFREYLSRDFSNRTGSRPSILPNSLKILLNEYYQKENIELLNHCGLGHLEGKYKTG